MNIMLHNAFKKMKKMKMFSTVFLIYDLPFTLILYSYVSI